MDKDIVVNHAHDVALGSMKSYVIGFILSIAFTLLAFYIVAEHLFTGWIIDLVIVGLGLVQAVIQLLFFLHLGEEPKPRWNLLAFLFMMLVVSILVLGTMWIIYSLDYRLMSDMPSTELHE